VLHAETLFKKAEILARVKKFDEALAHLDEALSLKGDDTEFKIFRVYYAYKNGLKSGGPEADPQAAIKQILILMKADPNIASGYMFLAQLYKEIAKVPLEGMIAKRLDSIYVQKRSRDWLKIKTVLESEVVIGGYTEPRHSRSYFGALVVGLYDDQGQLRYVGHAGGGFNEKSLEQIYKLLQPLKTKTSPFAEKVQTNEPVQWVKPKLVAQVKFAEWTADRRMRQPIFLGLREDKKPEEATFEIKRETEKVVKQSKRSKKRVHSKS